MRRDRLIALRTAALVAAGFVVLRVVYRILFGGGSGAGLVLADPPRVPLGGPFAGIFLFGSITTGGIATAALSAVPFAALILLVGLIGVVVDLRALLVRGSTRGPLRTVSRTLVIALSTLPALRAAVARVRIARQLRAERSLASLLVPVLEQTIERAIALGASMEVRGFAATRHPEVDRSRPVVIDDAALGYDAGYGARHGAGGGTAWILDHAELTLAPGTLTLVTGSTGSGKTTLLDAISGLFQYLSEGRQEGTILVGGVDRDRTPPRETAGFVGVVPQAVRWSFVASTVSEELGFALATQDRAPDVVRRRVAEVAQQLGITHLLDRQVTELSAGEACLVAIGGALASDPGLLILDEPLADLDTAARDRVVDLLAQLAHERGVSVVVAEHTPRHWGTSPDRLIVLRAASSEAPSEPFRPGTTFSPQRIDASRPILRARAVTARHGATVAVEAVDLDLSSGVIAALTGPNGAGKSSLLLELARPHARNTVLVDGTDVASTSPRSRRRSVALVPEGFDDMLFATSVAAECARADRRAVTPGTAAAFRALLGFDGLDGDGSGGPDGFDGSGGPDGFRSGAFAELLGRHPRDLSAGQRLCLVIAIQLSARPRVLLVDEPTRGLDPAARAMVGAALRAVSADGTAVIFATHDAEFAAEYATRSIRMERGRITEPAEAMSP